MVANSCQVDKSLTVLLGEAVGYGCLDPVRPRLELEGWGPISVGGYQEQEAGSDEDSERSQEGLEAGEDS